MRAVALALIALLAAGCTGDDTPAAEQVDDASDDVPATPTNASPPVVQAPPPTNASENQTQPPTPPTPPSPPSPPAEPEPPASTTWTVPFSATGKIATGATVCGPEAGCVDAQPVESVDTFAPEVRGGLVSFSLLLSWNATSDVTSTLTLDVRTCDEHACTSTVTVSGTSPLAVTVADAGGRGNPRIHVAPAMTTPLPADQARVSVDQEFSIDGMFLARERPAGSAGFAGHDGAS